MAASNAARGARYKSRTREWLEDQGFQVAKMETMYYVRRPAAPEGSPSAGFGDRFPVKRDQFGSDLLAVDATRIVFVQVKGGKGVTAGGSFPDARRKFMEHVFPPHALRWIVAWPFGGREPRVIDCTHDRPEQWRKRERPIETSTRLF